jgi:thiamine-monophosphate kinase
MQVFMLRVKHYNVDLIGGDTTSSVTGLVISVTAIGTANKDKIVYRSGAKENDIICVSGDLGAAYIGLQLMEREKEVFKANPNVQPEFQGQRVFITAYFETGSTTGYN